MERWGGKRFIFHWCVRWWVGLKIKKKKKQRFVLPLFNNSLDDGLCTGTELDACIDTADQHSPYEKPYFRAHGIRSLEWPGCKCMLQRFKGGEIKSHSTWFLKDGELLLYLPMICVKQVTVSLDLRLLTHQWTWSSALPGILEHNKLLPTSKKLCTNCKVLLTWPWGTSVSNVVPVRGLDGV